MLDISALAPTQTLQLDLTRQFEFVFLTEVTFDAAPPVPLPAGLPLMLTGIGAFVWMRRKRA